MLSTIFESVIGSSVNIKSFLLCTLVSLILGALIAIVSKFRSNSSKSFLITLALLPAIVQVVIMMVNGNIGAGVAVAGTFSLIRFRSAPGTAKEICGLFLAVAVGISCGMGYVGVAIIAAIIILLMEMLYSVTKFGESPDADKMLKVTIPEGLEYDSVFDDIFGEYTNSHKLLKVKTTNMGSLYQLTYNITLKDVAKEKEMIDKIRTKNGNLEISCGMLSTEATEL